MFILVLKCNCMCICVYFIIQTLSTQRQYIAIVQIGYCSSWSIFSIVALDFSSNVSIVQPCNSKTYSCQTYLNPSPPPPTSLQPHISSTLHYQLFIQCMQFTVEPKFKHLAHINSNGTSISITPEAFIHLLI